MIVADGDRLLLGRQAVWPPRRYSALAGFVEPGETLEEAVAREVKEESGVEIAEPAYVASQPWPFPASLMLGFRARWASRHAAPGGGRARRRALVLARGGRRAAAEDARRLGRRAGPAAAAGCCCRRASRSPAGWSRAGSRTG